jgi:hypothetical protein
MDPRQAAKELVAAGVTGAWVSLPAGGEEIAVFDPAIIKILKREEMR